MSEVSTHAFWLGASTLGPGSTTDGVRGLTVDAEGQVTLGPPNRVGENPMFLAALPGERAAIVHELPAGQVSLWSTAGGEFTAVGDQAPTSAADPCHVAASPDGSLVFVANYSGGTLTVHPVSPDGVGAAAVTVAYPGRGPRDDRQLSAHPHQAVVDAARGLLYVPDLGLDRVHVHRLADLRAGDTSHRDLELPAGSGPRHIVISGDYLLVACELDRTVVAVEVASGRIDASSPATAFPGPDDDPGTAAVRLTTSGYVIVGNRGPGTIGVLRWNPDLLELVLLGEYPCGGTHPRDLELTADERFVVVANQWSDDLAVLELDADGVLHTRSITTTPSPACVLRRS